MLTSPRLHSTWPGPVGKTYSVSPSGSGRSPFQDTAATIYTIANTGAMLSVGQKRSKEIAAFAAGPVVTEILTSQRPRLYPPSNADRVSGSHNHPSGAAPRLVLHPDVCLLDKSASASSPR